jgi:hypothetical protein
MNQKEVPRGLNAQYGEETLTTRQLQVIITHSPVHLLLTVLSFSVCYVFT